MRTLSYRLKRELVLIDRRMKMESLWNLMDLKRKENWRTTPISKLVTQASALLTPVKRVSASSNSMMMTKSLITEAQH